MSLMNRVWIMRLILNNGGGGDDAGAAAAAAAAAADDDDDYDDRTLNLPRNFFFMSTGNSKNTSQKFLMTG